MSASTNKSHPCLYVAVKLLVEEGRGRYWTNLHQVILIRSLHIRTGRVGKQLCTLGRVVIVGSVRRQLKRHLNQVRW